MGINAPPSRVICPLNKICPWKERINFLPSMLCPPPFKKITISPQYFAYTSVLTWFANDWFWIFLLEFSILFHKNFDSTTEEIRISKTKTLEIGQNCDKRILNQKKKSKDWRHFVELFFFRHYFNVIFPWIFKNAHISVFLIQISEEFVLFFKDEVWHLFLKALWR